MINTYHFISINYQIIIIFFQDCTNTAVKECSPDAHHLHCHHEDFEHIHLCIGDSIPIPNKCQQMTCLHYDGNVALFRGCHDIVPKKGCRLTEQDNSRPYPYCCPKEVCGIY